MAEAREQEPEVVLIGDTHIQRLAHNEVSLMVFKNLCVIKQKQCLKWIASNIEWVLIFAELN